MSVRWIIPDNVQKIKTDMFQVSARQRITIPSKSRKIISTEVSVEIASGMILISINNELKTKLNNFMSAGVILETGITENIKLDLKNDSSRDVVIEPGENICVIKFVK